MTFSGPFNLRWFWGCSSLHQQLRESALWNAWKVITAGVLPTRNGGQKGLCAWEPHWAEAENRLVGKERVGRIESRTDIHTPLCINHRANGKSLYNTGGSAWCSVMT